VNASFAKSILIINRTTGKYSEKLAPSVGLAQDQGCAICNSSQQCKRKYINKQILSILNEHLQTPQNHYSGL
jgi:hypothetical protein